MKDIITCPHCSGILKLLPDIKPKIPNGWIKIKIPDDENKIFPCHICKKGVKEGYLRYENYEIHEVFRDFEYPSHPKANHIFICASCARKNGVERQCFMERCNIL